MNGEPSDNSLRESRAALVLMGVAVAAVLIFGAITLLMQIGTPP